MGFVLETSLSSGSYCSYIFPVYLKLYRLVSFRPQLKRQNGVFKNLPSPVHQLFSPTNQEGWGWGVGGGGVGGGGVEI